MDSSSAGSGSEIELLSKTLQANQKFFYFDLKQNRRGCYLRISEKTKSIRSTIVVPMEGIACFYDIFHYYITSDSDDDVLYSKELRLDSKVFYFDPGKNKRGRFVKVCEKNSVTGKRGITIIVPEGSNRNEGWSAFRTILGEMNEEACKQQRKAEDQTLVADLSDLKLGETIDSPSSCDETDGFRAMRADQKRFFFDVGSNSSGQFLKISEVAGSSDCSSISLPLSGLKQFHEIVSHFVELEKDGSIQRMTGANPDHSP